QAALVAVQVLEIEAVAPRAGHIAAVAARFDLDDLGAPIGELAHRGRPGAGMRQIEHGETGQRQGSDAHDGDSLDLKDEWKGLDMAATFVRGRPYRQGWGHTKPISQRLTAMRALVKHPGPEPRRGDDADLDEVGTCRSRQRPVLAAAKHRSIGGDAG